MRQEIGKHLLVFIIYFGLIMILRWQWSGGLWGWWIGGLIGYFLVFGDRFVYIYFTHPHEQLSQQAGFLIKDKRWLAALELIHRRRREQQQLSFRSFLFMLAWVLLAVYVLTSKVGLYPSGLVMGVGLHLVYDMVRDIKVDPQGLKEKFFWQVKRMVSDNELKIVVYGFMIVFLGMSLGLL